MLVTAGVKIFLPRVRVMEINHLTKHIILYFFDSHCWITLFPLMDFLHERAGNP
jgi:hypothetical protein